MTCRYEISFYESLSQMEERGGGIYYGHGGFRKATAALLAGMQFGLSDGTQRDVAGAKVMVVNVFEVREEGDWCIIHNVTEM